jgi:glutathione S-transferase
MAQLQGFDVLLSIWHTPPSIAAGGTCASPPRRLRDFADFIDQVIDEYGDRFESLELWNEPNNRLKWSSPSFDPDWRLFGDMVREAGHVSRRRRRPARSSDRRKAVRLGIGFSGARGMYTLYIGNMNYSSWSLRPWLLMTELGIPFEERLVPFDDGGSWDKFRPFSPTGKVPCLHDGARVVWESLGIVEYLAEQHTGVWPGDRDARAWARSASAEMHAGFAALRQHCPMTVGLRVRLHQQPAAALGRDMDRLTELWNEGLGRFGGPFLAGDAFSAVDAFFAPVAFRVQTYGLSLTGAAAAYPSLLLLQPGMQQWQDAALTESWREPGHEAEIAALGECLEDLRAVAP